MSGFVLNRWYSCSREILWKSISNSCFRSSKLSPFFAFLRDWKQRKNKIIKNIQTKYILIKWYTFAEGVCVCVCVFETWYYPTQNSRDIITMLTVSQMVKMFSLVWHPKVDHHNHKWALSLARFMYSLHTPQFLKIHFNIILPSTPPPQGFFSPLQVCWLQFCSYFSSSSCLLHIFAMVDPNIV